MVEVHIHRGRTVKLPVYLGYDVSQDLITSQIRAGRSSNSRLIATWQVDFRTDGRDGRLDLTLDNLVTAAIADEFGWMDIKRVTAGEPVQVWDDPVLVVFKGVVTT